jgi:hypothetical protein
MKFSGKKYGSAFYLVEMDPDPDGQALDADPLRIWQNFADPTGSGSTTLLQTRKSLYFLAFPLLCLPSVRIYSIKCLCFTKPAPPPQHFC